MSASRSIAQAGGATRIMRIIARLNVGGPAIHVALLTAGLRGDGYDSILVTGMISPEEGDMSYYAHELGVEPVVLPTLQREISLRNDLRALRDLMRLMRAERPHIVHTHTAKAGFIGRLAARLTGVPVVLHTFHGHVFHGYFGWLKTQIFLWLERISALYTDAILTLSDNLRHELAGYRIAPLSKIHIVPLGFDLSPLYDLTALQGKFRAECGCSTETQLVGIIGRLVPVKNHDLFLHAATQVKAALPDTHFIIVGDGERRADLEQLVNECGLNDSVTFTGWRRDLDMIYADLDLLVISSINEGTPVSIIEAMAAGVPVVATAVGGVPDLLQHGKFGVLSRADDVTGLAQAMISTLQAPSHARNSEARAHAFEQFDGTRLLGDLRRLYEEYLNRKVKTRR